MTTDQLIDALVWETRLIRAPGPWIRFAFAAAVGVTVACAALPLAFGFRPDIAIAVNSFSFWMKLIYTLSLSGIAVVMLMQVSRPGTRMMSAKWLLIPFFALAMIAISQSIWMPPDQWGRFWLGHSALNCAVRIPLLAIPPFVGFSTAVRSMAPTRLRLAGALVGFTAASVAATVYGLACDEVAALFVLTWYSSSIALSTAAGALFGPLTLRW